MRKQLLYLSPIMLTAWEESVKLLGQLRLNYFSYSTSGLCNLDSGSVTQPSAITTRPQLHTIFHTPMLRLIDKNVPGLIMPTLS